jgi:3,4-dihydroxy 2-butanone 4-phosphate synthase/GTP cyclohydrolase II
MKNVIDNVKQALNALKAGGMVVLVDDEHRENEGDLIMAAQFVTPEAINFMAKYGRGLICMPMDEARIEHLKLPLMSSKNGSPYQTAFTVSIEASHGVSTGISAADRAHTIKVAISDKTKAEDLISPGHIFPLKARAGGVLKRRGQTEGSIDLMRLAGLKTASVICEIMNDDGTMSRQDELASFAKTHHMPILSIQDIVEYRILNEMLVEEEITARIPVEGAGDFQMSLFKNQIDTHEHLVLYHPQKDPSKAPLVRIHSECMTGDVFGSKRCDCGPQLQRALEMIAEEGGYLIYLRQEGRGIGLKNKLKAYVLQDQGVDTVDANVHLGLPVDSRDYSIAYQFLKYYKCSKVRLITNNPLKIKALKHYGIDVSERIGIHISPNPENEKYLNTKAQKLGHLLDKND